MLTPSEGSGVRVICEFGPPEAPLSECGYVGVEGSEGIFKECKGWAVGREILVDGLSADAPLPKNTPGCRTGGKGEEFSPEINDDDDDDEEDDEVVAAC
jgi:hypothetical protein